jgi:hypothetical protein
MAGRLVPGQRVTIDLDGEEDVVDAVTTSGGEARVLAQVRHASPHAVARLVAGSLGYLLFSHHEALIGLRGIARISAATRPLMEFVVVDGVERPERRAADRVAAGTRVTVASLGSGAAGEPLSTFTVNISSTGVLLKRPPGAPASGDVALELFFGADPSPVPARGQIVRTTDDLLAVHFEDIAAAQRIRLTQLLTGYRRSHRVAAWVLSHNRRREGI